MSRKREQKRERRKASNFENVVDEGLNANPEKLRRLLRYERMKKNKAKGKR